MSLRKYCSQRVHRHAAQNPDSAGQLFLVVADASPALRQDAHQREILIVSFWHAHAYGDTGAALMQGYCRNTLMRAMLQLRVYRSPQSRLKL